MYKFIERSVSDGCMIMSFKMRFTCRARELNKVVITYGYIWSTNIIDVFSYGRIYMWSIIVSE